VLDEGDNTRYYTGDANFNITATIDAATDEVVERFVYTAYGTATAYDADWATPAPPTTDGPLYCGYFFDAETALYQVRNRYYDSGLSTFISRDPVVYNGGINLYEYVHDRPLRVCDPTGLVPITCHCVKTAGGPGPVDVHYDVVVDCAGLGNTCCASACGDSRPGKSQIS